MDFVAFGLEQDVREIGSWCAVLTTFCTCCKPSSSFSLVALNFMSSGKLRCKAYDFIRQRNLGSCRGGFRVHQASAPVDERMVWRCCPAPACGASPVCHACNTVPCRARQTRRRFRSAMPWSIPREIHRDLARKRDWPGAACSSCRQAHVEVFRHPPLDLFDRPPHAELLPGNSLSRARRLVGQLLAASEANDATRMSAPSTAARSCGCGSPENQKSPRELDLRVCAFLRRIAMRVSTSAAEAPRSVPFERETGGARGSRSPKAAVARETICLWPSKSVLNVWKILPATVLCAEELDVVDEEQSACGNASELHQLLCWIASMIH